MAGIWHHAGCCCDCACAEMLPSGADWNGFVAGIVGMRYLRNCYQIDGYSDGDLTACADCDASGDGGWDGTFDAISGSVCKWKNSDVASISGKEAGTRELYWDNISGRWQLSIACDKGGSDRWIWSGDRNDTGDCEPIGAFTRAGGCDATSSLTIVAC